MVSSPYDAMIIGAGAAGLEAARRLAHSRSTALVIEARTRIGGRIWSHHEPGLPVPVELGAELVHGRAKAVFGLLERAATAAFDAGGEHRTLRDGKLERADDLFVEVRQAMQRTAALEKKDLSFDVFLERHLRGELSEGALAYARMLAEGFDAADPKRASARAIVEEWTSGASVEAPQFRPLGGYGPLLSTLARALQGTSVHLQLDTVVRTVRWRRGSVEVEGTFLGRPFRAAAPRAIVTLPLGVLQVPARAPGAVRFVPALTAKRDALKHLAPGPVLKVLLRFRSAFWEKLEKGRYCDTAFFHAPKAPFPTLWTALPVRTPLLVAWAAGPNADRLAGARKSDIISDALASLGSVFGKRVNVEASLESAWVHDWQSDPYARGAYSYVTVGGGQARAGLAAPLCDTLFFAGEATDTKGEAATVAGALQSGARAAKEVIASMKKR